MNANPEHSSGWEPAAEADLEKLYSSTTDFLKNKGSFDLHESSDIHGTHMGLPVTDVPPGYTLIIPKDEVIGISSRAKEVLAIDGDLEITYWEPCYIRTETGVLSYELANCVFDIPQAEDSPYKKVSLVIDEQQDGQFKTWRWLASRMPASAPETELSTQQLAKQLFEERKLEEQTGINLLTKEECEVLQEIVDGMNKLNAP